MPSYNRPSSRNHKRLKKGWIFLILLLALLFIFRKAIVIFAAQALLQGPILSRHGQKWHYTSIAWEGERLCVRGLQVTTPAYAATIDQVQISWHIDWGSLYLEPRLCLVHPQVTVLASSSRTPLPLVPLLFSSSSRFGIQWEIQQGIVQLPDPFSATPLYFSFEPGKEREKLGSLSVSYEAGAQEDPSLFVHLQKRNRTLEYAFHIQECDCGRILPLMALFPFKGLKGWDHAEGEVSLCGTGVLDSELHLVELNCQGSFCHVQLENFTQGTHLGFDLLEGHFTYPGEQLEGHVTLEGGEISLASEWGVAGIQARCSLGREAAFEGVLDGFLTAGERELPFHLAAKGSVHQEGACEVEGVLVCQEVPQEELKAFFSFRSPEAGNYACQIWWEDLAASHLAWICQLGGLMENELQCVEGKIQGQLELTCGKETPLQMRLENVIARDLFLKFPEQHVTAFARVLQGEMALERALSGQWQIAQSVWEMGGGSFVSHSESEEVKLIGDFKLTGRSDLSKMPIAVEGEAICFDHPFFSFMLPRLESTHRALFTYDLVGKTWEGVLPIQEAELHFKTGALTLQGVDALLHLEKGKVNLASWSAQTHLSQLHFSLPGWGEVREASCGLYYDSVQQHLLLRKGEGEWSLKPTIAYHVQLDLLDWDLKGKGLCDLALQEEKKEVARFSGTFQSSPQGWEMAFDRNRTHLLGTLLQIDTCLVQPGRWLLEMSPSITGHAFAAQLNILQAGGVLPLHQAFLTQLETALLSGSLQTKLHLAPETFTFHLESSDLTVKGMPLPPLVLQGHQESTSWVIDRLRTPDLDAQAVVQIQEQGISLSHFTGNWKQIEVSGSAVYRSDLCEWSCQMDAVKGKLEALAAQGHLSSFKAKGTFHASGHATWEMKEEPLCIRGETTFVLDLGSPVTLIAKNEPAVRFTYTPAGGLQLSNFNVRLYSQPALQHRGVITIGALQHAHGLSELKQCRFSLSPALIQPFAPFLQEMLWDSYLEGTGEMQVAEEGISWQATLKDGDYGTSTQRVALQQIAVNFSHSNLSCRFKTAVKEQPLWGLLQVDLSASPCGMLKVVDSPHSEGIKALFTFQDQKIQWESVRGSLLGIDCALTKQSAPSHAIALGGTVKLDGSRLLPLLSPEMHKLQLGGGYTFQGDLLFRKENKQSFQAKGHLLGEQFALLGYRFDRLEAQIEWDPEHLLFSNLKIEDAAGLFTLKKITIQKKPPQKSWVFEIPLLQIKELRPSLMKKCDEAQRPLKPLVIKNFSLAEIRGDLSDPRTWEGHGTLNFTNAFKKEGTLFDAPLELIKNLGLDPGLLTPVQGEVELELRGDKFYLTHLKNTFSEGNRSHFFLSPENETSYIDLEGKLHIDIRMRQEVVLKLAEAFTLTVRGTVDKPRYGLQY